MLIDFFCYDHLLLIPANDFFILNIIIFISRISIFNNFHLRILFLTIFTSPQIAHLITHHMNSTRFFNIFIIDVLKSMSANFNIWVGYGSVSTD